MDELPAVDSIFGGGFWGHVLCGSGVFVILFVWGGWLKIVEDLMNSFRGIRSDDLGFVILSSVFCWKLSLSEPNLADSSTGAKTIIISNANKSITNAVNSAPDNLSCHNKQ